MDLDKRMKRYEEVSKTRLLPKSWVILRVDGKAFHSFTRKMNRPFDDNLITAMLTAGEKTAQQMQGFKLGYYQSDEFSFALIDTDSYNSQVWFDGKVQKLCSVTASMFGAYFNKAMNGTEAIFDCRAFNIPVEDVANVFVWRQRDWEKNSLQMYARKYFSSKKLQEKKKEDIHEMLYNVNKNWANIKSIYKNGAFITKEGRTIKKKLDYESINNLLNN